MRQTLYAQLHARFASPGIPLSRRAFLAAASAAGVAALSACSTGEKRPAFSKRVVVLGAGLAGLICAHELLACGYDVFVIEARPRVGGRTLSFPDMVPGRYLDAGGEFVGENHPTWLACAKTFKLPLEPVENFGDLSGPIELEGTRLSAEQAGALFEDMGRVVARLTEAAKDVSAEAPWLSPNALSRDRTSLAEWLVTNAQDAQPATLRAMQVMFETYNGVPIHRQSLLAALAAIKGGGLEDFWTKSATLRCPLGAQRLSGVLAARIGDDRILVGVAADTIKDRGDKMVVSLSNNRTIECDDLVLAVPPSAWNKITFSSGLIPAGLAPQMGRAFKYLAALNARPWDAARTKPEAITDRLVGTTWSMGAPPDKATAGAPSAALAVLTGGAAAEPVLAMARTAAGQLLNDELEKLFPGYSDAFAASRLIDWPNDPLSGGAYAFPAPGEVTTNGPLLAKPVGGLHFAGDYCSHAFMGLMEGALQSGVAVAERIARRDGRAV